MDLTLYINGVLRTDLTVRRLTRSYVEPWTCELAYSGRHEQRPVRQWDRVIVHRADTGLRLFRGNVTEISPGGVAAEGIGIVAKCRRFRLDNEPVNINGSGMWCWNRRGHTCGAGSGEDSPGRDGGKWTAGEIVIDILEHALGIPAGEVGGSAIPGHHSSPGCVNNIYLTPADITGYVAADWLALDSVIGEFCVDNTPVSQAISELVGLNGGFYGWFIDPWGVLRVVDLKALAESDIEAGEIGQWQDAGGRDYRLLDNRLDWSLDGVYSRVMVQGTDKTVEVKPENLDGCANAALNGGGELELIAQPWKQYDCAYRALDQPYRVWTWKSVGFSGSCVDWRNICECGIPAGVGGIHHGARIYRGTDAGPKSYAKRAVGMGLNWRVNLTTGIVMFYWDVAADLDPDEKLWGWYWAKVPFTVEAGPDGNAYDCLGYERTLKVYDSAFKHPTSYPIVGTADDETAMGILAQRMLEQIKDIRVQGRVQCDEVDPDALNLQRRYSVTRLAEPTTTPGPCSPDPLLWGALRLNAVEVVYDFEANTTELTLANTFWMLEGYSAVKERLRLNEFAQRELNLSEDIKDCQVGPGDETPGTTITEWPTTTTTTGAATTTTTPGGCNGCDPPLPDPIHVTLCNLAGDFEPYNGDHDTTYRTYCMWQADLAGATLTLRFAANSWYVELKVSKGNSCQKRWAKPDPSGCDPWGTLVGGEYLTLDCYDDTCDDHESCENSTLGIAAVSVSGEMCPSTTTTTACDDCQDLDDTCYWIAFAGCCDEKDFSYRRAKVAWAGAFEEEAGTACHWTGGFRAVGMTTTTTTQCPSGEAEPVEVTLIYHADVGWMVQHLEATWVKVLNAMDPCDPTGIYDCQSGGGGMAVVSLAVCDCGDCDPVLPETIHVTLCRLGGDFGGYNGDHALSHLEPCRWGAPLDPAGSLYLYYDDVAQEWVVQLMAQWGGGGTHCWKKWHKADLTGCDPWDLIPDLLPPGYIPLDPPDCDDLMCVDPDTCEASAYAFCVVSETGFTCEALCGTTTTTLPPTTTTTLPLPPTTTTTEGPPLGDCCCACYRATANLGQVNIACSVAPAPTLCPLWDTACATALNNCVYQYVGKGPTPLRVGKNAAGAACTVSSGAVFIHRFVSEDCAAP